MAHEASTPASLLAQVVVHQWNAAGEFLTEILDEDKVRSVVDGAGRLAGRQADARLLMGWMYGHDG